MLFSPLEAAICFPGELSKRSAPLPSWMWRKTTDAPTLLRALAAALVLHWYEQDGDGLAAVENLAGRVVQELSNAATARAVEVGGGAASKRGGEGCKGH